MHSHDHHGHDHDHAAHASERRLGLAAALTGLFMVAETVGGFVSGSLALLADAGHMLVDFAGLALAFLAIRIARRPADAKRSYGYDRFQILVAYSNGLVLFGICAIIVYEAVERLRQPAEILAGPMLVIAIAGLLVNIAGFFILHGGDQEDLNLRGALLHVLGDLLGSVAAIAASLIIMATGWPPIDPILSVVVSLLILSSAYRLVRESSHILLEGSPSGIDAGAVSARLQAIPGLLSIHHVHVWMLTPKRRAATLHACLVEGADQVLVTRAIKTQLKADFAIDHATIETEHGVCADAATECAGLAAHDHGHGDHGHTHHALTHDHSHAHHDHSHHDGHSHFAALTPRPA